MSSGKAVLMNENDSRAASLKEIWNVALSSIRERHDEREYIKLLEQINLERWDRDYTAIFRWTDSRHDELLEPVMLEIYSEIQNRYPQLREIIGELHVSLGRGRQAIQRTILVGFGAQEVPVRKLAKKPNPDLFFVTTYELPDARLLLEVPKFGNIDFLAWLATPNDMSKKNKPFDMRDVSRQLADTGIEVTASTSRTGPVGAPSAPENGGTSLVSLISRFRELRDADDYEQKMAAASSLSIHNKITQINRLIKKLAR